MCMAWHGTTPRLALEGPLSGKYRGGNFHITEPLELDKLEPAHASRHCLLVAVSCGTKAHGCRTRHHRLFVCFRAASAG